MARVFLDDTAPPLGDAVLDAKGRLAETWRRWFGRMPDTLNSIPNIQKRVSLSSQGASISATDLGGAAVLAAGTYRATYYARISTAASVNSSLTVTLAWTDGVAQTYSGAAIIGNTTTTYQTGTLMFRADASSAITYATTYASNAAGEMKYTLDIVLERVRS